MSYGPVEEHVFIETLEGEQQIKTKVEGKYLVEGENLVLVKVTWKDEKGKDYETSAEQKVVLEGITSWQKVQGWFARMMARIGIG